MSIEIITPKQEESARLRELRLRALADAPYAFGADYKVESEKPLEYWQEYLRNTDWCFAVIDGKDIGLLSVDKADVGCEGLEPLPKWLIFKFRLAAK